MLYQWQEKALETIAGKDAILSAPTGSGKTWVAYIWACLLYTSSFDRVEARVARRRAYGVVDYLRRHRGRGGGDGSDAAPQSSIFFERDERCV